MIMFVLEFLLVKKWIVYLACEPLTFLLLSFASGTAMAMIFPKYLETSLH